MRSQIAPGVEALAAPGVQETIAERSIVDLRATIDGLPSLDLAQLRATWRKQLRTIPPATLTKPLLLRLLAYKLQARLFGDLDPATARFLDRLARDHARRRDDGVKLTAKAAPPVPPAPRERSLKAGTLLVREHAGTQHRVVVLPQGFLWQERSYATLSEIARAITGTRWNGPHFFGLRDRSVDALRERGI